MTENEMVQKIERLQDKVQRLEKVAYAPMQTPGPFVTGRSNYILGKRLDRENRRKARAFEELQIAKRELERLTSILKDYRAGERHLNGQRRADAPSRQRAKDARTKIAEFMRGHIKSGDEVAVAMNPGNHLIVKRVNKKSITDSKGERWAYDEILLVRDGAAVEGAALKEMIRTWLTDNEGDA